MGKILIEIPEEIYQETLTKIMLENRGCQITTLPQNHGRLIDERALADIIERMWKNKRLTTTKYDTFLSILDYVPTVIEEE